MFRLSLTAFTVFAHLSSPSLFGVTMLQAFVYFSQYQSDRTWSKLAVCWLWCVPVLSEIVNAL